MYRYSVLFALSAALLACNQDVRVAEIQPPEGSTSVRVVQLMPAPNIQLSFSLQRPRNDDSWTKAVEEELKSVGFEACSPDRGWTVVLSKSRAKEPNAERKVRFYEKNKSTFLAMIAITQTCDGQGQLCQQDVAIRQTKFPAEVSNRAELVHAICTGTTFPVDTRP